MEPDNEHIILEDEIVNPQGNLYSKLSFAFAMLTLVLFLLEIVIAVGTITRTIGPRTSIIRWFSYSIYATCFAGVICTIISFTRKEKLKYLKTIGAVLNILFFSLIVLALFYVLYTRWRRGL